MKYSAQYHVFPATFHVISRKINYLWNSEGIYFGNLLDLRLNQNGKTDTYSYHRFNKILTYSKMCIVGHR